MPKYIEANNVSPDKEKLRKRIAVFLLFSVAVISLAFVFTALVFFHPYFAFGAMACEVLSPCLVLMSFRTAMEAKYGGRHQGSSR